MRRMDRRGKFSIQKINLYIFILLFLFSSLFGVIKLCYDKNIPQSLNYLRSLSYIFIPLLIILVLYFISLIAEELSYLFDKKSQFSEFFFEILKSFKEIISIHVPLFIFLYLFLILLIISFIVIRSVLFFYFFVVLYFIVLYLFYKRIGKKVILFFIISCIVIVLLFLFAITSTVNINLDKQFYTCNDTLFFEAKGINIKKFEGIHFSNESLIDYEKNPNQPKEALLEIHPLEYDSPLNVKKIVYGKINLSNTRYCRAECVPGSTISTNISDFNSHFPYLVIDYRPILSGLENFITPYSSMIEVPVYCS